MKIGYKTIYPIIILLIIIGNPAYAWSNGGYSTDINNPVYGTHDFLLEKAINMLPSEMRSRINTVAASYGSEIPDCNGNPYCIGDVASHHVYYYTNRSVQADSGAVRAREEYNLAESYLKSGDTYNFSIHLGAMSHYISDVAVFGHTMGAVTDWGAETHHSDYETYVNNHLSSFSDVSFDGVYDNISAYNTTLNIARDTTFDEGIYTNVWMDDNYNWSNPNYVLHTKDLINRTTNNVTDVIYKLLSLTTRLKGDVDGDSSITASDALLYLRYAVGQNISPYQMSVSDDVTCDGNIFADDALLVLRKAVGQNVNLECS